MIEYLFAKGNIWEFASTNFLIHVQFLVKHTRR